MSARQQKNRSETDGGGANALRIGGVVVLALGIAVFLWGGLVAWFASDYGTQAEGSLGAQIVSVGESGTGDDPGTWTGMSESGEVIWQGTKGELDRIMAEGRAAHQADLRRTWLYPSLGVMAVGATLIVVAVVRERRAPLPPAGTP